MSLSAASKGEVSQSLTSRKQLQNVIFRVISLEPMILT